MENQGQELQIKEAETSVLSMDAVKRQIHLIQDVMREAMKKDEHYGVIPGTGSKPSLLKAGAEKLCLTFRMAPEFSVISKDLPGGHREVQVVTTLRHIPTDRILGQGVGNCSTMESKYRYRNESEDTGRLVPPEYWQQGRKPEMLGGAEFSPKKIDGQWKIVKKGEKIENPDLADVYNTVLKMAKKRSLVDAVLTATAASDIFVQDVEGPDGAEPERPKARDVQTPTVTSVKTTEDARSPEDKARARFWAKFKSLCPDPAIQRKIVQACRGQESTVDMTDLEEMSILDAAAEYAKEKLKELQGK